MQDPGTQGAASRHRGVRGALDAVPRGGQRQGADDGRGGAECVHPGRDRVLPPAGGEGAPALQGSCSLPFLEPCQPHCRPPEMRILHLAPPPRTFSMVLWLYAFFPLSVVLPATDCICICHLHMFQRQVYKAETEIGKMFAPCHNSRVKFVNSRDMISSFRCVYFCSSVSVFTIGYIIIIISYIISYNTDFWLSCWANMSRQGIKWTSPPSVPSPLTNPLYTLPRNDPPWIQNIWHF